jgi:hypothetical protein
MTVKQKVSILMSILVALTLCIPHASAASSQKISYFINGDCSDYFDMNGEYAFFQEEPDWSCYLTVAVKPAKPIRNTRLQFWNGRKWLQESSARTSSKGFARLDFDPICDTGNYCDGTWKYRVFVDAISGQKSNTSITFEVSFYSGTVEDPESDY